MLIVYILLVICLMPYFLRLLRVSCVARVGCNDEFSSNERIRQSNGPSKYRCSYCQGTQKHSLTHSFSRSLARSLALSLFRALSFSFSISLSLTFPSYVFCRVSYVCSACSCDCSCSSCSLCHMSNVFFSPALSLPPSFPAIYLSLEQELPHALVHTREALMLAEKQKVRWIVELN